MTWPRIRAAAILLAIAIGVIEGLPLENQPERDGPIGGMARRVRAKLLVPFAWIGRDASVQQKWRLFPGSSSERYRLEVEGLAPGGWVLLYRLGDDEHDAYGATLEYRRVRGAWNPRSRGVVGQYAPFAAWFAERVLADHPELSAVRLQMRRIRIADGTVIELGGEPAFPIVRSRTR